MNRISPILNITLVGLTAIIAGCNIIAPAAYIVQGPAKVDAEFKLPDQPTVVFIDDRRNVLNDRAIRAYLGDKTGEQLLRHKVLSAEKQHALRSAEALNIARADQAGELQSLEEIGAAIGAAQVIYIDLYTFQIETPDGRLQTQAQFGVKVIDVVNRVRLFPEPESQAKVRQMVVALPPERTFQPMFGREARRQAELALADLIADKVSKLFYKHEPGTPLGHQVSPEPNPKAR